MRIGIISDIHANAIALRRLSNPAVQERMRVDVWWVLGDLLGYGPDPVGVLEWMQTAPIGHWHIGNHDLAFSRWGTVAYGERGLNLSKEARISCLLHRAILRQPAQNDLHEAFLEAIEQRMDIESPTDEDLARAIPSVHDLPGVRAVTVHGSPVGSTLLDWIQNSYLRPDVSDHPDGERLRAALDQLLMWKPADEPIIGFVGHSHIQFIASLGADGVSLHGCTFGEPISISDSGAVILINPGSVGKPHDGSGTVPCVVLECAAGITPSVTFYRESYANYKIVSDTQSEPMKALMRATFADYDYETLRLNFFPNQTNEKILEDAAQVMKMLGSNISNGSLDSTWATLYLRDFQTLGDQGISLLSKKDG